MTDSKAVHVAGWINLSYWVLASVTVKTFIRVKLLKCQSHRGYGSPRITTDRSGVISLLGPCSSLVLPCWSWMVLGGPWWSLVVLGGPGDHPGNFWHVKNCRGHPCWSGTICQSGVVRECPCSERVGSLKVRSGTVLVRVYSCWSLLILVDPCWSLMVLECPCSDRGGSWKVRSGTVLIRVYSCWSVLILVDPCC